MKAMDWAIIVLAGFALGGMSYLLWEAFIKSVAGC